MRLHSVLKLPLLIGALMATSAQAELIEADWQTAGDKLITQDTSTGLSWLDLTQTQGMSIPVVQSLLGTTFSGWRLPTKTEVVELGGSFFSDLSPGATRETVDLAEASRFRELLGPSNGGSLFGLLFDAANAQTPVARSGVSLNLYMTEGTSRDINAAYASYGVFLVADTVAAPGLDGDTADSVAVPGPAGLGALSLGLLALGGLRRRHR